MKAQQLSTWGKTITSLPFAVTMSSSPFSWAIAHSVQITSPIGYLRLTGERNRIPDALAEISRIVSRPAANGIHPTPNEQAHGPGRDSSQRQPQAGKQHERNHAACGRVRCSARFGGN